MSLRVRYTNQNGFYTGDSSYAIAWLALGNRTACDAQFLRAFRYMNGLTGTPATATQYNPFQVFKEREQSGGHINFAVSLTAETLPRTLPALRPRSAMRMPDLAS